MEPLFQSVNELMKGGFLFAMVASFIWGILSVALSPCHLTSIPLIIGFVDSTEEKKTSRRFVISLFFAVGIVLSIAGIGVITASAGRIAGDLGPWTNWFAAIIFAVIGFHFLDIIPLSFNGLGEIPLKKKGRRAAFIIGLLFGVALGPCTFAFMAPVLAVTFVKSEFSLIGNVAILFSYGVGHSFLMVLAGTFTGSLQKYLHWTHTHNHTSILKKIAGVLLLIGSLYFIGK